MKDFPKRARCVDWRDGALIFDNGASIEAREPTTEITERLGALSGMVSFHACGAPLTDEISFSNEALAFLDAAHQLAVMDTAASLAREGRAVVLVLHDLCLALRRADSIAVMDSGAVTAWGGADEVFASGALERAFKVKIRRVMTPDGWQYYYV